MKQVVAVFADYLPTPPDRGLGMIFLATVSVFNVLPLGGLFVFSPLAAITHFLGHFGFSLLHYIKSFCNGIGGWDQV